MSLILVVHLDPRECAKKFEMTLMLFPGAWGKIIHEKKLKQKSHDTVPLTLCCGKRMTDNLTLEVKEKLLTSSFGF